MPSRKLALYGDILIGRIDAALPASSSNFTSQVKPGSWWSPGCQESLDLTIESENYEHEVGCSGSLVKDFTRETRLSIGLEMGFTDASAKNFAAFLRAGEVVANATAQTVTNQTLNSLIGASSFKAGDIAVLGHMNITALTIQGDAVALVLNTNYELDPVMGIVRFLVPVTGPVIATTYSYQNPVQYKINSEPQYNYVVLMTGRNKDGEQPGQVALFNTKHRLNGSLALTTNELSTMSVASDVLIDSTKSAAGQLGQFGIIRGFGLA
jgi:hypothetical protein